MNLVASRATDFCRPVSLTTSRQGAFTASTAAQASATEQLINQRQNCRDTVGWAAWNFLASNDQPVAYRIVVKLASL